MCGIFCSLSRHGHIAPNAKTKQLLQNRGPDSIGQHRILIETGPSNSNEASPQIHATFLATVLSLRGTAIVSQPLVDDATGSVFCWNGEAWSINGHIVTGNDSELVFAKLVEACSGTATTSIPAVINLLSAIRGPYAFVFYDARNGRVYFGRDCLGRRSLLRKYMPDGALVLSSVCDYAPGDVLVEVEADGIYVVDLRLVDPTQPYLTPTHVPHQRSDQTGPCMSFPLPFPTINRTVPISHAYPEIQLGVWLERSLELRTQHIREAIQVNPVGAHKKDAKIAILFSGGLDCTILASLCHALVPTGEPIDLLNVAFENPRIHAKIDPGTSPYELCPDRITGRSSHAELTKLGSGRIWRFVEVNVPYTETQAHRATVMTLMHPHNTEMDLSISYALYFAARGIGVVRPLQNGAPEAYSTTAHVLLSGLGADELFGGYQRHATAFARQGYPGLIEELELDFNRLGKRNLGRDDRVISNSGKEVRFPYLDEDFIARILELPVTQKCDFGNAQVEGSQDPYQSLEPGKRALRYLALLMGMERVAAEKKRAIQFGARTAKMETGRTKGTQVLT